MSEIWVRGAEAVMSAFLLSTVYCAYIDGDKLIKMELYLLEGIYVCASLTYALLNSMHRVHVNSEWHWRLMNEEWLVPQMMIICASRMTLQLHG